jgi:hypothetical protein
VGDLKDTGLIIMAIVLFCSVVMTIQNLHQFAPVESADSFLEGTGESMPMPDSVLRIIPTPKAILPLSSGG